MSDIRFGIIGAGAISGIYLKNMTTLFSDTLKVVSIAARNLEHAEKRAAEYASKRNGRNRTTHFNELD